MIEITTGHVMIMFACLLLGAIMGVSLQDMLTRWFNSLGELVPISALPSAVRKELRQSLPLTRRDYLREGEAYADGKSIVHREPDDNPFHPRFWTKDGIYVGSTTPIDDERRAVSMSGGLAVLQAKRRESFEETKKRF